MSIALVLDTSGSMRRAMPTPRRQAAAIVRDRAAAHRSAGAGALLGQGGVRARAVRPAADHARRHRPAAGQRRHGALCDALYDSMAFLQAAPGPARHRAAVRRPRREQPGHRARQRAHRWPTCWRWCARPTPSVYAIGLGAERRPRRARALAAAVGRHGDVPGRCQRARRRVPPRARRTAPALRRRLHLDQRDARRRLAAGGGRRASARRHHPQRRRLLRADRGRPPQGDR